MNHQPESKSILSRIGSGKSLVGYIEKLKLTENNINNSKSPDNRDIHRKY